MSPRGKAAVKQTEEVAVVPAGPALVIDGKLNFEALEATERKTTEQIVVTIRQGVTEGRNSVLKVGEALIAAHGMYEPRRLYGAFLNGIGFARSTANRYVKSFKAAAAGLPELIMIAAIAAGIPMYGTDDEPYGRYTKIVKKLKFPHGILTPERARDWVQEVQAKYKAQQAANRRNGRTPEKLQEKFVRLGLQTFHRVPQEQQITWLSEGLAKFAEKSGLVITVALPPPPAAATAEHRPKVRAATA